MKRAVAVALILAASAPALVACGGSASTSSPAPTSCAARVRSSSPGLTVAQAQARCGGYATECAPPNDCASPEPSTTPPSEPSTAPVPEPTSTISYETAGVVCAALNALELGGSDHDSAAQTVETAYNFTDADVVRAREIRCPDS
jgi:hypothetical protein